jgi:hypothetical protein
MGTTRTYTASAGAITNQCGSSSPAQIASWLDRSGTAAISSVPGLKRPELPVRRMTQGRISLTATLRRALLVVAVAALGAQGCATPPEPPQPPPEPEEVPREVPPAAQETPGETPSAAAESAGEAAASGSAGESAPESTAAEGAPAGAEAPAGETGEPAGAASPAGQGTQAGDPAGELGQRFEQSLGDFDAVLLSEQAQIAEQRRRGVESAPPAGSAGRPGAAGATGEAADGGGARPGPAGASGEVDGGGSAGGALGSGSGSGVEVPPDVGSGADDDIVARQLREAAMKEQDPELREKLWDEYRKYKQGTQR